jgi:hypothetical protein
MPAQFTTRSNAGKVRVRVPVPLHRPRRPRAACSLLLCAGRRVPRCCGPLPLPLRPIERAALLRRGRCRCWRRSRGRGGWRNRRLLSWCCCLVGGVRGSGRVHRPPGTPLRECPPACGLLLDFAAGSTRCPAHLDALPVISRSTRALKTNAPMGWLAQRNQGGGAKPRGTFAEQGTPSAWSHPECTRAESKTEIHFSRCIASRNAG